MKHLPDLMLSQLSLTAAFDLTLRYVCIITSSDWNWSGVIEEQSELTTLGFVHYEDVMQFTLFMFSLHYTWSIKDRFLRNGNWSLDSKFFPRLILN